MDCTFSVKQIGLARADEDGFRIELMPEYREALVGLEGFSYVNVVWWFSGCDNEADRLVLSQDGCYINGPDRLGAFATRSPQRPNPIALSCAAVTDVDAARGVIGLAYLDADDRSPVLDIKPYTPSLDRVDAPEVPAWCRHWPKSVEASGDFDWASEFNF